ncbi:Wzz/FepE/Etk N-terminal domain-containing protein [Porphyrobacter sp. GA68]|uniref:GumC family protein n=1 Tax=Porphyrobacter sp. GA68 TaxID=2883480 RepID=UPI001D194322|nr:Wzz/FepE/Etk N-terminal domain-containing protein [Porphyrobacter sp. GA68]
MDQTFQDEPQGPGIGNMLAQLPTILRERRWWIIIPSVIGVLAAVAAILLIRPLYESSALMLVESPQIQDQAIASTGGEVVDRRIARIRAEVISRPNLISLIERHGLYASARGSEPLSATIERMREAISLEPTTVEVPGGGGNNSRTIAFRLAYEYNDPRATQAVTQDLMDRILELDSSGNVEQATNTVQFLSDQSADLEQRIAQLQGELTAITAANGGVLSGAAAPVFGGGAGNYEFQIAQLQRDNVQLAAEKTALSNADNRDPNVLAAEARLASLRAVYTEDHPDVAIAKRLLAQARQLSAENQRATPTDSIDRQIAFNNSQIAALRAAQAREQAIAGARMQAQSRGPLVQQQMANIQQELSGLNTQYQDVQQRLTMARAGVKAEDEQIAERLAVVEPPVVPDEPIWPNRPLILAICILGGLGLGFALAMAVELFFRPIRDPDSLAAITGEGPLAVVPVLTARPGRRASGGGVSRFFRLPRFGRKAEA